MSATTTQVPEAAAPRWALPALSFASSLYLHVILTMAVVAAAATFVMGLSPHVISTGSMRPAINPGDLVLTSAPEAPGALALGEVITYRHPNRAGELVTHRIVDVLAAGGYRTRGDANGSVDAYIVEPGHVVGVGRIVVPMIGLPATWLRLGLWLEFALFVLASVIAFAGVTLRLEDEQDGGEDRGTASPPVVADQPASTWQRLGNSRARTQVTAIAGLAAAVFAVGVLVLDRRSGLLLADRLVAAAEAAANGPAATWRLTAIVLLTVTACLVVRAAEPGGRRDGARLRVGLPPRLASGLAWLEHHGALFVATLAVFVMMGAGSALAHTAAGAFNDATESTATITADQVAPPAGLAATAGCDGSSPTVDLSWTASTTGDADGYEVRRGPTAGGESLLASLLGRLTTGYLDTSVANSTTYSYEVSTTLGTWTSDPAGNASASVTTPDCSPPDMWVSSLDGAATDDLAGWTATVTVTVVDENGPVGGATVSGDWVGLGLPPAECTTDGAGQCTVSASGLVASEVTLTVTGVTEAGHQYVEPTGDPSITILAP